MTRRRLPCPRLLPGSSLPTVSETLASGISGGPDLWISTLCCKRTSRSESISRCSSAQNFSTYSITPISGCPEAALRCRWTCLGGKHHQHGYGQSPDRVRAEIHILVNHLNRRHRFSGRGAALRKVSPSRLLFSQSKCESYRKADGVARSAVNPELRIIERCHS